VGVLEAGEHLKDMPNINIPGKVLQSLPATSTNYSEGLAGSGIMNEQMDWRFLSVPQAGVNNRSILHPR
jgi:hypothetical protein